MKKILVVIDMQNDFIDGALGTPEAVGIVDNVCKKIREGEWNKIYTTSDTHDENYLSTQEGKKLPIEHCIDTSHGWLFNKDIFSALDEYENGWDGADKNTFGSLKIAQYISEDYAYRTDMTDSDLEIHIVGVCTDICVITNALLLKTYFPEAKIVVDASCCAGSTPLKHDEALDVMRSCQIDLINDF